MAKDSEVKIEAKDIKVIDGKVCLSSKAMYMTLNVEESTLVRWGQAGCPKMSRGWWVLSDVLAWRGIIDSGEAVNPNDEDISKKPILYQKAYYETKLKEAQVEATNYKNAISRGDYIPKEDIVAELKRFFVVLKTSMQGYSKKIATELSSFVDPVEARKIEKLINDITLSAFGQLSINGVYDSRKASQKAT